MRCGLPTMNRVVSPKFRFTSWTAEGAALELRSAAIGLRVLATATWRVFRPTGGVSTTAFYKITPACSVTAHLKSLHGYFQNLTAQNQI